MPKSKLNEYIRWLIVERILDIMCLLMFFDFPTSRIADKYSASNLPSVPHIMDIAVIHAKINTKVRDFAHDT